MPVLSNELISANPARGVEKPRLDASIAITSNVYGHLGSTVGSEAVNGAANLIHA